jgi:hypothetical protein
MKITVAISDSELKEIRYFTGEKKKGPAIRKMVVDALMLRRRQAIGEKFISGKLGTNLAGFEKARATERQEARKQAGKWR